MGESEIQIAIKMFDENAKLNVDPHTNAFSYNLNNGLLAMARAMEKMQKDIDDLKLLAATSS